MLPEPCLTPYHFCDHRKSEWPDVDEEMMGHQLSDIYSVTKKSGSLLTLPAESSVNAYIQKKVLRCNRMNC